MKVLYFAWLREHVGRGEEEIEPPPGVATVAELMSWLAARGEHVVRVVPAGFGHGR